MHILYYYWTENSSEDIKACFEEMGFSYIMVSFPLTNYDSDPAFETELTELLEKDTFDFLFTFNYFPVLSKIADTVHIPYVCWIYDCPHLTLYSHRVRSPYTHFFLFDKEMCRTLTESGAIHVSHLPLAVNTKRLKQLPFPSDSAESFPVSFVGSLYENNSYRRVAYLPEHLRGYLDGIINAQQKIWGGNVLQELLTEELSQKLKTYIQIEETHDYSYTVKDIFLSMLEAETTCRERTRLLPLAARYFETHLFTASDPALAPGCIPHGYISYTDEMPLVFRKSDININISLRSIHSGIPLRCMDIMGAGGLLLSNYQPELFEFFLPDEEFVCYTSEEEFTGKIRYLLEHDKDRVEIAANGYAKIQKDFSYPVLFGKLLDLVFNAD